MFRLFLFMHHIALCTPCIALVNYGHLFAYTMDHVEPRTKIQVQQVQGVFEGPQASSDKDINLPFDQGKSWCI
jgi:hypothetical protein